MAQTNVVRELIIKWGFAVDEAKKLISDLYDFAKKTPFTIPGIEDAALTLLGVGIESDKIVSTLKKLGDVAAGTKAPLFRLAWNFAQVKSQTKLTGREIKDFGVLKVPILAVLAKQFGKTTAEISKMVSVDKILFEDVDKAFTNMASKGGKFFNLMFKLSESLFGIINNVKDSITILAREIGWVLLPEAKRLSNQFLEYLTINKKLIVTKAISHFKVMIKFSRNLYETLKITLEIFSLFIKVIGGVERAIKLLAFALLVFLQLQLAVFLGRITLLFWQFGKAVKYGSLMTTFFNASILRIPVILGTIIILIALLIEDIIGWTRGLDSLTGAVVDFFEVQIKKVKEFLLQFETIRFFWDRYKNLIARFTKFYEEQSAKRLKIDEAARGKIGYGLGYGKEYGLSGGAYKALGAFAGVERAVAPTPSPSKALSPINNINLSMPVNVTVNKDEDSKKIGDVIIQSGKSIANDFQDALRRTHRANTSTISY